MNYDSYSDCNDYELIGMVRESSEDAKDILFNKYRYIIDCEVKKYSKMASIFGYDYSDLYQDALVGFADALYSFREDKDASLSSFITLCVDRRLIGSVKKAGRLKNKLQREALSLEHKYEQYTAPLAEFLSDKLANDPLSNIVKEEKFKELIDEINDVLSPSEHEVYDFLISGLKYDEIALLLGKSLKQVDNSIQRIRNKIKKIVDKE